MDMWPGDACFLRVPGVQQLPNWSIGYICFWYTACYLLRSDGLCCPVAVIGFSFQLSAAKVTPVLTERGQIDRISSEEAGTVAAKRLGCISAAFIYPLISILWTLNVLQAMKAVSKAHLIWLYLSAQNNMMEQLEGVGPPFGSRLKYLND